MSGWIPALLDLSINLGKTVLIRVFSTWYRVTNAGSCWGAPTFPSPALERKKTGIKRSFRYGFTLATQTIDFKYLQLTNFVVWSGWTGLILIQKIKTEELLWRTELWEGEAVMFTVDVGTHRRAERVNSSASISNYKYVKHEAIASFLFPPTHTLWEYRESLIWCFTETGSD